MGTAVAQWLRSEGRWFDPNWCPSDRSIALGSTQPLTEMSTSSISWGGGKKRPVRKADNLTTILGHCHVIWEP